MAGKLKFKTTILQSGKTTTGIEVPAEIVEKLGVGKKPPVKVTINGYTYRNTVAVMGGRYMISVSADVREKSGVKGGDSLEVILELDTEPKEVKMPPDFKTALDKHKDAAKFFEGLSYSAKLRYVLPIEQAKTDETKMRRITKAVEDLKAGRK